MPAKLQKSRRANAKVARDTSRKTVAFYALMLLLLSGAILGQSVLARLLLLISP